MWPFKKQKEDLDLTVLAKRGLIKTPKQEEDVDLTQSSVSAESGFGFLGAMASSTEPSSSSAHGVSSNKIDDIEYKLDALSKRLNSMIDRIDLTEKKVDRLERHGA